MSIITLKGIVFRSGRGKDAVVFIDREDQDGLKKWWKENKIDTTLTDLVHPMTGKKESQINANTKAKIFADGTHVKITIDVRPWKKDGIDRIGIKNLNVVRM